MQLPPKRFQSDQDTKYDSIRHLPWFYTLAERRGKIELLRLAHHDWLWNGETNISASDMWGVDQRELRDYSIFVAGSSRLEPSNQRQYQKILDNSYETYIREKGARALTKIIYDESPLFGVNPRHVVELWEVDPTFYPSNYTGIR